MGDGGVQHPPTQLEEITSKISDLNKWREIFGFHSLEISNTTHQRGWGSDDGQQGEQELPHSPSSIPKPLLVPPDAGGRPISLAMAMALRELLFGNVCHIFSHKWAEACFRFHEPYSDLAYALEAEKGGASAILMAVQAHIIKYLLFVRNTEHTHLDRLCRVSRREQGEALAVALAELLWAAGTGGSAVVCLAATDTPILPRGEHRADGCTERIQMFDFSEKAAAQEFIFDHINCFKSEGSHGVILFLYSLLFSRTMERVREDLGCPATPLLAHSLGNITCTQAMLSLLLTGQASPLDLSAGAPWRGEVGYLCRVLAEPQACPGLRTPRLPIWLCGLPGGHGVLFSTDHQLLCDWKRERVFPLHFYNGQRGAACLTIDTHSHHWEEDRSEEDPGRRRPAVEMAIRTKWAGATVGWNGTDPFF